MVRMAHEADVADIVTAFQKSAAQEAELPSFGTTNFDQVPMYAPEQMEQAAVRDLITNINQRLKVVEDRTENIADNAGDN